MGGLFTILFAPVRTALVLMTIASVSATALVTIPHNEPPFDPFAPYADILPGQSPDAVLQRGFNCRFNITPVYNESCTLTLETGIFSEIRVWIARDTGWVSRVVFIPREKTLTLGDLVFLWGSPEIAIYSQLANLRWRNVHIVAIPQTSHDYSSYWLPIIYVAFESAE
jgi:hypothetical protein